MNNAANNPEVPPSPSPSISGKLCRASFASLTTLLLFHFLIIKPYFGFGNGSMHQPIVWSLYTFPPVIAAFVVLFRGSLFRSRKGVTRFGLLFLVSAGLVLGVVVVSWLILAFCFVIGMSQHQGGL